MVSIYKLSYGEDMFVVPQNLEESRSLCYQFTVVRKNIAMKNLTGL